jgi:hypothetical protein
MISDGSPTQCSQKALTGLVASLTRNHGIRCAQVAVEPLKQEAFRDFLDVSSLPMGEATLRFARLLSHLTRDWR